MPNQLGVDYNAHVIDSILIHMAQRRGLAPYRGLALSTARARIVTRQQIEDYQAVI